MTSAKRTGEETVAAIRDWNDRLPAGTVTLLVEELQFETVISISPARPTAAPVELRIGRSGDFGLYLGALSVDDLPSSPGYVVEILNAISAGKVFEETWTRRGKVQKQATTLQLESGDLRGVRHDSAWSALGLSRGKRVVRRFDPY